MKTIILLAAFCVFNVSAQTSFSGQLNAEDQKYYKNESAAGMNQLERIDSTVKEINKLHADVAFLKTEVAKLKREMEELKKKE